MTPTWASDCGRVRLYLGDCETISHEIELADALVTDPPYGIKAARANFYGRGNLAPATDFGHADWDDRPVSQTFLDWLLFSTKRAIVWGGNYYTLPPSSCWLIWDKRHRGQDFADAELAWTNLSGAVRKFEFLWAGMWQENMKAKEVRVHPTQKPIPLMRWCVDRLPVEDSVFDPYMGSGSTGVACASAGRGFVGIEREPKYFDIAKRRIQEALGMEVRRPDGTVQKRMFTEVA